MMIVPRILTLVLLCASLAACGLPKPRPADDVMLDAEFNAAFNEAGLPAPVPPPPGGVVRQAFYKIFGDPAHRPKKIIPPPPVPPEKIEPVPPAPRAPGFVWQPSAWEWDGTKFVWVQGRWVRPPAGLTWQGGRWTENEIGQYVWITGGWS